MCDVKTQLDYKPYKLADELARALPGFKQKIIVRINVMVGMYDSIER